MRRSAIVWHRPRRLAALLAASLSPLALLVPTAIGGAGVAAAAPAAGYTASLIPTGQNVSYVAVDPDTDTAYTAGELSKEISVVDAATNTVTGTISLPAGARGIAVDAVTDTIYVTVEQTASNPAVVDVIDGATNTVTTTVILPTGSVPAAVAVDSSTDTVYVAEQAAAAVAVIDGSTNSVTTTISTGAGTHPYALAVDETSDVVWVGETNGDVLAVSGSSDSVTQTISLTGAAATSVAMAVAVDPVTDTVYAATSAGGIFAVIDGATGTVSTTITGLPNSVYALAVDPGSGTVFASTVAGSNGTGTTWVIDAASNTVTDTIDRGGRQNAVDTSTGSAYIAPAGEEPDAVSVLTPSTSNAASPIITSSSAVQFFTGVFGSFAVTASALPAATYTEAGQLPTGITFSSSGVLAGTAAAGTGGSYPVTITASNGVAPDFSQAFTLTIAELPSITIPSSATVQAGSPASIPIQVTGNPVATSVIIYSGGPPGLTITSQGQGTWLLGGTPAAGSEGVYPTIIAATNANGTSFATITITVAQTPSITSADQVIFDEGTAGSFSVTATGFPAPTFSETGLLPGAVSLGTNGVLSGTPAAGSGGRYPIQITASNAAGTTTQSFTLIVDVPGAPLPAAGVLGDVTGDGLADILAIDQQGQLWLDPNTGSGDANMFADGLSQVGYGWNGYALAAVAPLYGSARAGILAIDPAGNLWYYPNTGGTGTSTFGARSRVGSGWNGYYVVGLTDLHGTGRPGLLAMDSAGNLWYYPNTGGKGTSTFGARSKVGSGWNGYTADVADINGDGSPDLLAVDSAGTMWLYPNVGGTGTSTFGARSEVSSGWAGYRAIDIGQLTSTGPASILGSDPAANLWYYPNTGAGAFGAPVRVGVGVGWSVYTIN